MALKIKVKRIAGVPSTSNLETGEIGLNTSNNQLYVNISGTITAVGGSGSRTRAKGGNGSTSNHVRDNRSLIKRRLPRGNSTSSHMPQLLHLIVSDPSTGILG